MGGPFVDIPPARAGEVRQLLDTTMKSQQANIEFAGALMQFYDQLNKEAKGQSLEPYYEKKPAALNGYVELNYDYYNHPIVRFLSACFLKVPTTTSKPNRSGSFNNRTTIRDPSF